MIAEEIQETLFGLHEEKYRNFQSKLIPSISPDTVIGVRTPKLRQYARILMKREDIEEFLSSLPHQYFEENQLHAFIVSEIKDYDRCIEELNRFLPFVDNWATCDQISPKVFKNHKAELPEQISLWLQSSQTYIVRFGMGMLMKYFLDEDFDIRYLEKAAAVRSEEYYVQMMTAWIFAEALAKQYESALPFLDKHKLDVWTHNKTIQKAVESYRIPAERKEVLKSLKIRK